MGFGDPLTDDIGRISTMEECMMMRHRLRSRDPRIRILVLLVFTAAIVAPIADAAESDLWTSHSGPGFIPTGTPITVVVGYGNLGPDPAVSAYINSFHTAPMGLDVFIDDLVNGNGAIFDAIQASAEGTDTLGNAPKLFWNDFFCEDLLFQLQRSDDDDDANPVEGLDPGVGASFSYEVTIPMEAANTGTIEITEPASMAEAWTGSNPAGVFTLQAAALNTYARGGCEKLVGTEEEDVCEYINDNCFGGRVSLLDTPIETEFELVNDGTADPTLGCEALVNFTPGNIALLRRGSCEFGVKAFNAEQAGAVAVFMVNHGQCSDFPASDQCVINLGTGALGGLVTIPTIMVAQADGEPVITAVEGGQTVRGVFGSATVFSTEGYAFLSDFSDVDPNETNDTSNWVQPIDEAHCSYAINPEVLGFSEGGGQGTVAVTTEPDCAWTASTAAPWISLTSGSGTVGSGTLVYDVAANTGPGRSAIIEIADRIHSVTQASGNGCTTEVTPSEAAYPTGGGTGSIEITTQPGCPWAASSTVGWLVLTSPSSGVGSASLSYNVNPNVGMSRFGDILVDNRIHHVIQAGINGCDSGYGADDGIPENGYGWGFGSTFVQRFTPPSVPFLLDEVCTAFTQGGGDSTLSYHLVIYDDDGPGGGPGTLIDIVPSIVGAVPQWLETIWGSVFLDGNEIVITEGSVYLGVAWDETTEIGFYVAADESPGTPAQTGYSSTDGVTWDSLSTPFPQYRSLIMRIGGFSTADGQWQQVVGRFFGGGNGFGDSGNTTAAAMASYAGSLFVGTENTSGAEIHHTIDGQVWQIANSPGFGDPTNRAIATLTTFDGDLFAATANPSSGAQVWRTNPPPSWPPWIPASIGGFGDSSNSSIPSGSVFDGYLYFGTSNTNGCEIWRTDDGSAWNQLHTNGFGDLLNLTAESMAVFNGELYVGTSNINGAQLWKSPDGTVWFPVTTNGFGTTNNTSITDLTVMDGAIFAGVSNPTTGAEIWRSVDGTSWLQNVGIGFGDPGNSVFDAFSVGDRGLAAGVSGPTNPGTIWISADGLSWGLASSPGFTNQNNRSTGALKYWNYRVYAGTSNPTAGCEVWRSNRQSLFEDGFESGDSSGWTMTIP